MGCGFCVCVCVCVCVRVCVRVCAWRQQGNFNSVLHTFHSMHAHCIFYDQVLESTVSTTLYLSVPFLALPKLPSLSLVRHTLEYAIMHLTKFHVFIT